MEEIGGNRKTRHMWNEFFVERYANERHEAHLREASHDRLADTTGRKRQRVVLGSRRTLTMLGLSSLAAVIRLAAAAKLIVMPR